MDHEFTEEDIAAMTPARALVAMVIINRFEDALLDAGGLCTDTRLAVHATLRRADLGGNQVADRGDVMIRITRVGSGRGVDAAWIVKNRGAFEATATDYARLARDVQAAAVALRERDCPRN